MRKRDVRFLPVLPVLACFGVGCLPSQTELGAQGPLTQTFAVSDYFTPSGYMGDGENFGMLTAAVNEGCKQPRPVGARGDCYVFTYYPHRTEFGPWAGVYWVFPANNWGSIPGRAIDTSKFQQVRFSAAIETPRPFSSDGAPRFLTSVAGRIDPKGHFDALGAQLDDGLHDNIDAFDLSADAQVDNDVGTELKTFRMPITDFARTANCSNPKAYCVNGAAGALIGAFAWALPYPTDADPSRTTPVKLYLDDIVWDTDAPPTN